MTDEPQKKDRSIVNLMKALAAANAKLGTDAGQTGGCRYVDGMGVSHCENLTQDQCNAISGAQWDPKHPC